MPDSDRSDVLRRDASLRRLRRANAGLAARRCRADAGVRRGRLPWLLRQHRRGCDDREQHDHRCTSRRPCRRRLVADATGGRAHQFLVRRVGYDDLRWVVSTVAQAPSVQRWRALGTTAVLRTSAGRLAAAVAAAQCQIARIDTAANRFDPASDLSRVNAAGGRRTAVSPLTVQAVRLAVDAAAVSRGAVDPTIGQELVSLGYDRDWDLLAHVELGRRCGCRIPRAAVRRARRRGDRSSCGTTRRRSGFHRRSGSTSARPRRRSRPTAAAARQRTTGGGVLVSLGGDIATAGACPDGGWPIHVTDDHRRDAVRTVRRSRSVRRAGDLEPGRRVAGSTTGDAVHHILDPATGRPVDPSGGRRASPRRLRSTRTSPRPRRSCSASARRHGWPTASCPPGWCGRRRPSKLLGGWPA